VTTSVTVRPVDSPIERPVDNQSHQYRQDINWTADDLRDYVVTQIQAIHGDFPRKPPYIELGIFKAFLDRWGVLAPAIARYAYGPLAGYWNSAPIRVERFCFRSDPYFAKKIVDRLS